MGDKAYLIISRNTGQMMLVDRIMRINGISAEIVPAPPGPGLMCTKAVKVKEEDIDRAKGLLEEKRVAVFDIVEDEGSKLLEMLNKQSAKD